MVGRWNKDSMDLFVMLLMSHLGQKKRCSVIVAWMNGCMGGSTTEWLAEGQMIRYVNILEVRARRQRK